MTHQRHHGILRTYRPEEKYGFIHERISQDTLTVYYFNARDVISGEPIVGLECDFFTSGQTESRRQYPHAIAIEFQPYEFKPAPQPVNPTADAATDTLGKVIDAGTFDGEVAR